MLRWRKGTVIDVQILDRKKKKGDELEPGTLENIMEVAIFRHVVIGDKLAGRLSRKQREYQNFARKVDMPSYADGTPVDIIISDFSFSP